MKSSNKDTHRPVHELLGLVVDNLESCEIFFFKFWFSF